MNLGKIGTFHPIDELLTCTVTIIQAMLYSLKHAVVLYVKSRLSFILNNQYFKDIISLTKLILTFNFNLITTSLYSYFDFIVNFNVYWERFKKSFYQEEIELELEDDDFVPEVPCFKYPKRTDMTANFAIENGICVITDIIGNTRLFVENVHKMRINVLKHFKMVIELCKHYKGHYSTHEGDSFHLVFPTMELAVNFSKSLRIRHAEEITHFKIRIGITEGPFRTNKTVNGYMVLGEKIKNLCKLINHNVGKTICIEKEAQEKHFQFVNDSMFCIH